MVCKYCGAKKKFRYPCPNCYDIDFDNVVEIIDRGRQVHRAGRYAGTRIKDGEVYEVYKKYDFEEDTSYYLISIFYFNGKVKDMFYDPIFPHLYAEQMAKINSFQLNPHLFDSSQEYVNFVNSRKLFEALTKEIFIFPAMRGIQALKNAGYSKNAINYAVFTTDYYKPLILKLMSKINIMLVRKQKRDFLNEAQTRMNELVNSTDFSKRKIRRILIKEGIPRYYINFVEKYFFS